MDSANTVEYKLRDLPTRSVTLFPTRAQIYREIKDVPLKPGDNKITVIGLSPTVDKDSIKVEGSGLAVITDISVTQEQNHEIFEEIYPEHDTSVTSQDFPPLSSEEVYENDLKNLQELPELKEAKARYEALEDDIKTAEEAIANATERLRVLDSFSKNLGRREDPVDIAKFISTYQTEREKMFKDQQEAERKKRQLNNELTEAGIKMNMYNARQTNQRDMVEWERSRERAKKDKLEERERRRKMQELQKQAKKRKDLLEFWPKYVYNVCITLDANQYTPMSSRRNSVTSEIELAKASPTHTADDEGSSIHCDLLLSYVTSSAFWAPSYDMQLNTTSATGTLLFDAQLHNSTSETWSNCHVTLSTSQATATSIEEPIPTLVPWHIRLIGKTQYAKDSSDDISLSKEEQTRKTQLLHQNNPITSTHNRSAMFNGDSSSNHALQDYQMQLMLLEQQNKKRLTMARKDAEGQNSQGAPVNQMRQPSQMGHPNQMAQQRMAQQQAAQQQATLLSAPGFARKTTFNSNNFDTAAPKPSSGGLFGSNGGGGPFFGSRAAPATAPDAIPPPPPPVPCVAPASAAAINSDALSNFDFDTFLGTGCNDDADALSFTITVSEPLPALDFKDSLIEETGLTTAYDLPGTKTLAPGATSSKHRVARLSLSNIAFSYTIVPKYKPVAYLKAKIRNGSKLTLLRGTLGLTLDGGFMGRTTLPRCSAGETLTLGLGIDPAVKVRYPGPDVRRATTGLFSKEDSSIYSRSITLENTRSSTGSKPCHIFVHDQVPVSEDERLKVVLQVPRNLAVNGGSVKAGKEGAAGDQGKAWGEADAIMKETGTVTWNVKLNPGKAVKLDLEYVIAMPSGGGHTAVSLA
ncbi:hypothetical protein NLU13_6822 [Sarocladium strictum]|uniref:Mucoidy inhibitor-like protein n=1 Tax=Sarocladium strictum TaxID=5046 RepID=A0AA39GE37_SARSR|nr:hypothetical protein NLU13_6822 [Sarocladium strictum]